MKTTQDMIYEDLMKYINAGYSQQGAIKQVKALRNWLDMDQLIADVLPRITKVEYIGHHGQTLDDFRSMLSSEPLEPIWGEPFEVTATCEWVDKTPPEASKYKYLVSGNFYRTSCAFRLWTNDESLIKLLQDNIDSQEYKDLAEMRKQEEIDKHNQ